MKINIVTVEESWVLRHIAEDYASVLPNSIVSLAADKHADINFYINYNLYENKTNIDVGYFTHRELKDKYLQERFDRAAREVDWCISMCEKTSKFLPKRKTTTIHPSPDKQFLKEDKIVFGIAARESQFNRKRLDWIDKLKGIPGIEIILTNGNYSWEQMPNFYKQIDYLLILAENEGGPLSLYEALAMGVPIISSDAGASPEYTTIIYKDFGDLKQKIEKLIIPKNSLELAGKELMLIFQRLKNE